MYYQFEIQENGMVDADVSSDKGEVHFNDPARGDYGKVVPITGNTYPYKDEIKETDWEETHRRWNKQAEYWQADLDTIRRVINQVCRYCPDVTVEPEVVEESGSLKEFRGEISIGEKETFEFLSGPNEGDERVSRSWAEDAAEVGNYDGVEDFAEQYNLNVVDDKELFDDYEEEYDVDEEGLMGSQDMGA